MPQAAVAVAFAAASAAIGYASIAAVIGQIILMVTFNAIIEGMQPKTDLTTPPKKGMVRDSDAPLSVVYGKVRVSGPLVYWTTKGSALYYVVAFCEHEVEAIDDVIIDGKSISDPKYAGRDITYELYTGTQTQTASPLISGANPSEWTSNHKGTGVAYIAIRFGTYEEWETLPSVSVIMRGAKVYDPRKDSTVQGGSGSHRFSDKSTWEYSTNPALIALHYLTSDVGFDEDINRIDLPSVMAAANACDQLEEIPPGATYQKRYECNVALSTADSRKNNLEKILQTMLGKVVYVGGKWRILAGVGGVAEFTITEDDVIGNLVYSSNLTGDNYYNYVSGTYTEPSDGYDSVTFPPAKSTTYETEDGRRFQREIKLEGVTDVYQAQRIAIILLKQSRQQKLLRMTCKPTVLRASVQSLVNVNLASPTLPDVLFRVVEMSINPDFSVELTLVEELTTAWDVALSEYTTDVSVPVTIDYDPLAMPAPANFQFYTGDDAILPAPNGVVLPRAKLVWDPVTDQYLDRYRLRWKKSSDTAWDYTDVDKNTTTQYLVLEEGVAYDFEVFAINALEKTGAKASLVNRIVTAKTTGPDQPGAITYSKMSGGVELTLDVSSVNDKDIANVEFTFSTSNDRNTATFSKVFPVPSDFTSLSEVSYTVSITGLLYVWARLINTSGQVGAWNTVDTNGTLIEAGLTAEEYGERQSPYNLVTPYKRSQRIYSNTIIIGTNKSFKGLRLSSFELMPGDYVSCSLVWQNINATGAYLEVAFYDDVGNPVGTPATTTPQAPPGTFSVIKLEGILIPVGAVRFSFKTYASSGTFYGRYPVFNRGMTVLHSVGGWGDRFLDPDDDTNLEWGDFQNLLDGSVESPVEESANTTGGGGPYAPPSSGGGYYQLP